jgi:hypothetical protein
MAHAADIKKARRFRLAFFSCASQPFTDVRRLLTADGHCGSYRKRCARVASSQDLDRDASMGLDFAGLYGSPGGPVFLWRDHSPAIRLCHQFVQGPCRFFATSGANNSHRIDLGISKSLMKLRFRSILIGNLTEPASSWAVPDFEALAGAIGGFCGVAGLALVFSAPFGFL